jgi:rSAM/selenodomain-associated transferase 1
VGEARVVVFARAPVLGQVKSRLAAEIGAAAALDFYRAILTRLVERLSGAKNWRTVVAVTPDEAAADPFFKDLQLETAPQGGGDLGHRMARFLELASPDAPVVIVGSDVPDLHPEHVCSALEALKTHELVLGPCPDGGYWLIGANRPPGRDLFRNVRWSSPHARADTLANAQAPVALLDWLEDVDEAADYQRFIARRNA